MPSNIAVTLWVRALTAFPVLSARLFQRSAQKELNLAINAAQIIVCPAFEGEEGPLVETE